MGAGISPGIESAGVGSRRAAGARTLAQRELNSGRIRAVNEGAGGDGPARGAVSRDGRPVSLSSKAAGRRPDRYKDRKSSGADRGAQQLTLNAPGGSCGAPAARFSG